MTFNIRTATEKQLTRWDDFVDSSINGTIFHKLKFLSYHRDRFQDGETFLVIKKGDDVIGQMAVLKKYEEGHSVAVSPYGGSYGGIVFKRNISYSESRGIVEALISWLRGNKIRFFRLTFPPRMCVSKSLDSFYFALLEAGFTTGARDITSVVKLCAPIDEIISGKTRNIVKSAFGKGVSIHHDCQLSVFWALIDSTYSRHGVSPTHSKQELGELISRFPGKIKIHVAKYLGIPVAGICEFEINHMVNSSFYFCRGDEHNDVQGLSVLVKDALERSKECGFKYYDFGTSSVNMVARPNVFSFKEGFGAEGIFREVYSWEDN